MKRGQAQRARTRGTSGTSAKRTPGGARPGGDDRKTGSAAGERGRGGSRPLRRTTPRSRTEPVGRGPFWPGEGGPGEGGPEQVGAGQGGTRRHESVRRQPRKRFGQHFLERAWVEKLIRDIAPARAEAFIEIGPGRGALTRPLAASGARIRAIDIDHDLAADLAALAPPNVTVVTADFLTLSADALFGADVDSPAAALAAPAASPVAASPVPAFAGVSASGAQAAPDDGRRASADRFRVVGNLPYNISSPILFRLLALSRDTGRLIDATLMLQREVADRVVARPGTGDYGPLSVLTAVYADVERRFDLPPGAFRPSPKVHSSVIRLRFRPPTVDVGDYAHFARLVRTIFQQRRKTIENALRPALPPGIDAGAALAAVRIEARRRPETLSLQELADLARATAHKSPSS